MIPRKKAPGCGSSSHPGVLIFVYSFILQGIKKPRHPIKDSGVSLVDDIGLEPMTFRTSSEVIKICEKCPQRVETAHPAFR